MKEYHHETTATSKGYHTVPSFCLACGKPIHEYRPVDQNRIPPESRGKRVECYECLARWWAAEVRYRQRARANRVS